MYKIENRDYGYRLTFGDFISANEMKEWFEESKIVLQSAQAPFGVFVDIRTLRPLLSEARTYMEHGQRLYKTKGMSRSVVILSNLVTKIQFKKIADETGIYEWERYIDESSNEDWEKIGLDWVIHEIDSDLSQ